MPRLRIHNTYPCQCQRSQLIHSNLSIMHAAPHIVGSAPFLGLVGYLTVEDHTEMWYLSR